MKRLQSHFFKNCNREKKSFYQELPQDTPNPCRYTLDYSKSLPTSNFFYRINPETANAEVRKPVTLKKPCLDDS